MELLSPDILQKIKSKALESAFVARAGLYFAEGFPLIYIDQWIQHGELKLPEQRLSDKELFNEVVGLIKQDVKNIDSGLYDLSVIRVENPMTHIRNLFKIYKDSIRVSKNKKQKKSKEFSAKALEKINQVPEYYRRNFHYQTDGYLSEESAQIYDHQVDILFRGTSDAMRRLILKPMVKALGKKKRLNMVEVGCGTGISTYPVVNTFKNAHIKAVDLSEDYIEFCRQEHKGYKNINFIVAKGESLDFLQSSSQDAWFSVYMFHELPKKARQEMLKEAYRVLKPGGYIFIADSIQMHDRPDLKVIMETFPKNFHEPFYKNYSQTPLEALLQEAGFNEVDSYHQFITKVAWAQKPKDK